MIEPNPNIKRLTLTPNSFTLYIMQYQIEISGVEPQSIAIIRDYANASNIADKIRAHLSTIWNTLRAAGCQSMGRSVVLYNDEGNVGSFGTEQGMPVEIGVEIGADFVERAEIVRSTLPEGTVLTVAHFGAYQKLGAAHAAVRNFAKEHGHTLPGHYWEIYGHWTVNEEELRTDVFYLVKP
jgi:effector-binding domain-containing protein